MNLDEMIVKVLGEHGGKASKDFIWKHFNNYSKGYLYERLEALRYSRWMIEYKGMYILTEKGVEWARELEEEQ